MKRRAVDTVVVVLALGLHASVYAVTAAQRPASLSAPGNARDILKASLGTNTAPWLYRHSL
jgi:hypothetical protein